MDHDAWFFIGVFAFIFVIWIATGGPLHPLAFTGPTLPEPQELGGGTYLQLPRSSYTVGGPTVSLPGSSNGSNYLTSPTYVPTTAGGTYSPPSDYGNVVSLSNYVTNASSTNPRTEYVQISVAQNASGPLDITDWSLESGATAKSEVIPKGTKTPTSGVVNAKDDIVLEPGERAYIITGESPVGASFRENKCTGYFGSFQTFSPPLAQYCPAPSDELATYYGTPYIHDPSCIDYANSLGRCQVALTGKTVKLTQTCQDFLEAHFNYNGCVTQHRGDADFNGNTWRIYLGRDDHLWRSSHELVKLIDDRGKTVAQFTY